MTHSNNDAGARSVRVEDVARVAGVSPITVSRALSSPEKVREETRKRVAEAVAETGYVVNSIASTLRSGRSSIITVLISSLQNPHFALLTQGLIDAVQGSRYRLMFTQTGISETAGSEMLASLMGFRPAAVVSTQGLRSPVMRQSLSALDVPVLEMWHDMADPVDMLVSFSIFETGQMMGSYFADQGYRHIAFCGNTLGLSAARVSGFEAGLRAGGAQLSHVEPVDREVKFADGFDQFDRILAAQPQTDAIFFSTDILATGAVLRARQKGVRVPQDVALAGVGDLDFAAMISPSLTSIHVPAHAIGFEGGRMLLARLEGRDVPEDRLMLPTELKVRGSTGG